MTKPKKKQVAILVDEEMHKKIKLYLVQNGTSFQKLVEEFLKEKVGCK